MDSQKTQQVALNALIGDNGTRDLEIKFPGSTKGTGIIFTCVSQDSEEIRKLRRTLDNRRLDNMARTRKMKLRAEEIEAETITVLSHCVKSWKSRVGVDKDGKPEYVPTVLIGGEQLACTPENVQTVLRASVEALEQTDEFTKERTNFLTE